MSQLWLGDLGNIQYCYFSKYQQSMSFALLSWRNLEWCTKQEAFRRALVPRPRCHKAKTEWMAELSSVRLSQDNVGESCCAALINYSPVAFTILGVLILLLEAFGLFRRKAIWNLNFKSSPKLSKRWRHSFHGDESSVLWRLESRSWIWSLECVFRCHQYSILFVPASRARELQYAIRI